jgi:fructose-1,6-bisphosphatase I
LTLSLGNWLKSHTGSQPCGPEIRDTILALAEAGRLLQSLISQGELAPQPDHVTGRNADGDDQKQLDIQANDLICSMLESAPVGWIASEEMADAYLSSTGGPLAVAMDPLDGSSNVDTNLSLGTIFSIYDARGTGEKAVLQCGHAQLAAGYLLYGPQTSLALTLGNGTHIFTLDRARRQYFLVRENIQIPDQTREYAINSSNFRHWDISVRTYIEDCLDGRAGPRGEDFNTRWLASLVAECQRIFTRGGIFLYPGDSRPGYADGRLRLVYEANAIALLTEQAGGRASTGTGHILDVQPETIHQRIPLIFGSREEVERVEGYYCRAGTSARHSPLFTHRGLFASQGN